MMRTHGAGALASPKDREIGDSAFKKLSERLEKATGIVLSESKKGLAVSRLSRRLRQLSIADFDEYCKVLDGPAGAEEFQTMIQLLTTNVTDSLESRITSRP